MFWAINRFLLAFKNAITIGISDRKEGEAGCPSRAMAGGCSVRGRMPREARQDVSLFDRQDASIRLLATTKTVCSKPSSSPILIIGLRSGFRETVHRKKRETGLEPATACLE